MPSFGLNGATTGDRVDVEADIRAAAEAGYQFVELRDAKIARYLGAGGSLAGLRAQMRDAGVAGLSINALEDSTLHVGEAFEPILARCRTLCEWAKALDCPYVIAVPSFLTAGGPPGGDPPGGDLPGGDLPRGDLPGGGPPGDSPRLVGLAETEVRRRTTASLRKMTAEAAGFGVRVGFEFLGFPTCSVSTLRAARGVIDDVGDPRLGLVIDAFHFYVGGSQPEDLDGLDASRVFIVHLDDAESGDPAALTDAQRLLPGEGVIPLRALITRLQTAGYRGAYSLELFRPEYWTWDPVDLARRGLASMRRLVA